MIRSLDIQHFRSFTAFKMESLGRLNLLVGDNNSGKTSLLEAIDLLLAHGDPRSIWTALSRRGERMWTEDEVKSSSEVDICRIFNNYSIKLGCDFSISASSEVANQTLVGSIVEISENEFTQDLLDISDISSMLSGLALNLHWNEGEQEDQSPPLPLSDRGGLSIDVLRRRPVRREDPKQPTFFIGTSSLSADEVSFLLGRVVLNPEEELLLKALRIIEPDIERIAAVPYANMRVSGFSTKGGVVVKCKNIEKRIPVGTMGDGIWRLLGIALAMTKAENGVLLIDEIDTGLHYSAMENMWNLVYETAQRLNVQVFATTHSNDCWSALSTICEKSKKDNEQVCIHRIERLSSESVRLNEDEILIAAKRNFEIR